MEITIELVSGRNHEEYLSRKSIQKNIDALQRAIDNKSLSSDFVSLLDTMSILEAIKRKLPII